MSLKEIWWKARSWWWGLTGRWMGTCRVCGRGNEAVYVYDPRGLWAYPRRRTWCPEHCPEHDYDHDRDRGGWSCVHCADPAPDDYYMTDSE